MNHLTTFVIDRMLAGLAPQAEAAQAETHTKECAACSERLSQARAERDAFLVRNPPEARAAALRARRGSGWWRRWIAVPGLAAVAAAAGLLLLVRPHDPRPDILAKGGPAVEAFAHRPSTGKTWAVASGATLQPGDALQLKAEPAGFPEVALYGLDAHGALTPIFAARMDRAGLLPSSLVVDQDPDAELLLIVFAKQSIPQESVAASTRRAFTAAGRRLEAIEITSTWLGDDAVVRSFLVRKQGGLPTSPAPNVIPGQ